jgi:SagB-type dehydrogenase family enzyme
MENNRKFLRFFDREEYQEAVPESDQAKKKPIPIFEKEYPQDAILIDLIPSEKLNIGNKPFFKVLNDRKSRRKYTEDPLSLEELSYLLWSTQGVKRVHKLGMMRVVPSAGQRNPFETYLVINRVEGITPGLYRYISLKHKLLFIKHIDNSEKKIGELAYSMDFVGRGAVIFCWVAVPYRTEWRYTILAQKFLGIEVGLVCENLYLACEAAGLGTVAIGYYEQKKFDTLFDLDGMRQSGQNRIC